MIKEVIRGNINHQHHHYRQHQVVPVAKKCRRFVLDESERVGEDNVHGGNNNDMLDRAAGTAQVAGVLPANVTTVISTCSVAGLLVGK